MNNLVGITVNDRKTIVSVVSIVPSYRDQSILLCIIANFLIILCTANFILAVITCFIDGTKFTDHHRISLWNEFAGHLFELRCHIGLITPACSLRIIRNTVSPLCGCTGLCSTEIPWIIIMYRDHNSFFAWCNLRRQIIIGRKCKSVILRRVINIGIPSRNQ